MTDIFMLRRKKIEFENIKIWLIYEMKEENLYLHVEIEINS